MTLIIGVFCVAVIYFLNLQYLEMLQNLKVVYIMSKSSFMPIDAIKKPITYEKDTLLLEWWELMTLAWIGYVEKV